MEDRDYEKFKKEMIKEIKLQLGDEVEITENKVTKSNGIVKDGVTVRQKGASIAPTVYMDDMYPMYADGSYTIENLAKNTIETIERHRSTAPELPELTAESARKNLYCVVVNAEENEVLLKTVPHEKLEDLAVIPRFRVGEDGSFVVTNDICKTLQMTSEEVMEAAHANTEREKVRFQNLSEVMRDMMVRDGMPEDMVDAMSFDDMPMWVLTNERGVDGAAFLTSNKVLKECHERLGEDYYILPSSRHEVLLVPQSFGADVEQLRSMVHEVNGNEAVIAKTDILSDSVYRFNGRTLTIAEDRAYERDDEAVVAEMTRAQYYSR